VGVYDFGIVCEGERAADGHVFMCMRGDGGWFSGNGEMFEGAEGTKACEALCKALAESSSLRKLGLGGA
jgi:hypothetical protein